MELAHLMAHLISKIVSITLINQFPSKPWVIFDPTFYSLLIFNTLNTAQCALHDPISDIQPVRGLFDMVLDESPCVMQVF